MRTLLILGTAALTLAACGDADTNAAADAGEPAPAVESDAPSAVPVTSTARTNSGTAQVRLVGDGVDVTGEYPATGCGGPFMLGEGFAYQTQAGDWRILVASENRTSGSVPLDESADQVNVSAVANGPGVQFARGPGGAGSVTISEDFRRAEAKLDLRGVAVRGTARLEVTFTCDG